MTRKSSQIKFTTITKAEADRLFKDHPARPGRDRGFSIYADLINEVIKGKPVLAAIDPKQTNYIRARAKREHGMLLSIRCIDKNNVLIAKRAA